MNCNPGDLAVIVNVHGVGEINKAYIGRVVVAVSLDDVTKTWHTEPRLDDLEDSSYWLSFDDSELRPIRDNDGEDQTLTWAGKPSDIKTPEAA